MVWRYVCTIGSVLLLVVLTWSLQPVGAEEPTQDASAQGRAVWHDRPYPARDLLATKWTPSLTSAAEPQYYVPRYHTRDDEFSLLRVEFESEEACAGFALEKTHTLSRCGRFAEIFVPYAKSLEYQDLVSQVAQVRRCETSWAVSAPPAPKASLSQGVSKGRNSEAVVSGGVDGLTGKGVVVAIVDTGVDFRHPDFIASDAAGKPRSRVLWYWDLCKTWSPEGAGAPGPVAYPNGQPIGVVYDNSTLSAVLQLEAATSNLGPVRAMAFSDYLGGSHGTCCAGIAAGNGRATPEGRAGVAPEADLIAVRIGSGSRGGLDYAALANVAYAWLKEKAGAKPLVVSCSWGGGVCGNDGESLEEQYLNTLFPLDAPGRAICVSAGNRGESPVHASLSIGQEGKSDKLEWIAPSEGAFLEIYVHTESQDESWFWEGDVREEWVGGDPLRPMIKAQRDPGSGHVVLTVPVEKGVGSLTIWSNSGESYRADAYAYGAQLRWPTYKHLINTPGGAANAITVGSYDWNKVIICGTDASGKARVRELRDQLDSGRALRIGGLSFYSSPGPLRAEGGVQKPDIVAPGSWFLAATPQTLPYPSSTIHPAFGALPVYELPLRDGKCALLDLEGTVLDPSRYYATFRGTSAACPYVAGVVALMFQKRPTLTPREIKELLAAHATRDDEVRGNPDGWGNGKLDLEAVKRVLHALDE